jgi:type IV pilus secretin PilQ/predicted competence protein
MEGAMFSRITVTFAVLLAAFSPAVAMPVDGSENNLTLRIEDLQYLESTSSSRLVIRANLPFTYKAYSEGQTTLVIETEKADTSNIAPGITIGSNSIESIKVATRLTGNAEEATAFSIRHNPGYRFTITPKGRRLFIEFFGPAEGRTNGAVTNGEVEKTAPPTVKSNKEEGNGKKTPVEEIVKEQQVKPNTSSADQLKVDQAETEAALNYRLNPVVKYTLVGMVVRNNADDSAVILSLDRPIERRLYRVVPVAAPPRFVIDLHGASNSLKKKSETFDTPFFSAVRTAQFSLNPYPVSRVVIDLKGKGKPVVVERGNDLVLLFGRAADSEEKVLAQEEPQVAVPGEQKTDEAEGVNNEAPEGTDADQESASEVTKAADREPESAIPGKEVAAGAVEGEKEPALSSQPVDSEVGNPKEPEPASEEQIETVEPSQIPTEEPKGNPIDETEVEPVQEVVPEIATIPEENSQADKSAGLTEETPAEIRAENAVSGEETNAAPALSKEPEKVSSITDKSIAEEKQTPAENKGIAAEPISENVKLFEDQYPDGLKPSESASESSRRPRTYSFQEEKPQQKEVSSNQQRRPTSIDDYFQTREITSAEKQYFGKKVSLEFETINLRALILLLGQMTDKNFVLDPSVQPVSVTISLRDLPWDQALDIILDYYGLGKIEEGNVIRIASRVRLAQEAEERRKLLEQQALAVPLRQVAKPINYAKAESLAALLRRNLSSKGEVVVDQRTNTLVITDIPSKVDEHLKLIEALDIPTKQVIVEARIVETTRDFINEFGLQYGFRGSATSEYGSSTGVVFPNQVTISGGSADVTSKGLVPFAVNLPANTVNTSLLGSFGNINGSFVLDAILTAAESEKKVRVLSRPRISAQNNARAEIKSGIEVPFQVVQNNTVGIRWREATLKLEVTPHITSDSTVILDLVVDKSSLGVATAAGYTIQKRAATSTVLVKDGGVAVIGGVLEISNNLTVERVPLLGRLPIIGRLFRNKLERVQNTELLIFISPKIIN